LTGLAITPMRALGETLATAWARSRTMEALAYDGSKREVKGERVS
jgi:hypothetical protein